MPKKLKRQQGFTLIELIIVIAIIAVLVLLVAPKFINYIESARLSRILNDIRATEIKIDEYRYKMPTILTEWKNDVADELADDITSGCIYNRQGLVTAIPTEE